MSSLVARDIPATTSGYRRPTWRESVAAYLPARFRARGVAWASQLPLLLALVTMVLLVLRLGNTAFIDEALYINAGRDYLDQWRLGVPAPDHAASFSGVPVGYPVLAALLDALGGLWLVRAFSLAMMVVAVVAVHGFTRELFGDRAGVLAAAAFALAAPVVFLGFLATFDALCVALLAVALRLTVTRTTWTSAAVIGLLLALATMAKYTAGIFVPAVLVVLAVAGRRPVVRTVVAGLVVAATLGGMYLAFADDSLRHGIEFTTTGRAALAPTPAGRLVEPLVMNLGPLVIVALVGALLLLGRWRTALLGGALLAAAVLLPAGQMYLGEAVSFDKHTGYAALFLAPVAGRGLQSLSRGRLRFAPIVVFLLVALLFGGVRSPALGQGWVEVTPVLEMIEEDPRSGLYISSSADVLEYYTRDTHPGVAWETTFTLYAQGEAAVRRAVADARYVTVILRSASTGNPMQDAHQEILLAELRASDAYALMDPIPVRESDDDEWLVFQRVREGAAATNPARREATS